MPDSSFSQAGINRAWARQLFVVLERYDVRHVCVAPGSRSTPLTLEAEHSASIQLHTHFDERGLGFMALGMAKVSSQPIAIVVTSGTAVANLLPAVAEANLTGEKLVLLTADRPPELVGVGANQAIVQSGLFSSHVTCALDLPCPSLNAIHSILSQPLIDALSQQASLGGAIHINCPFREPLYVSDEAEVDKIFTRLCAEGYDGTSTDGHPLVKLKSDSPSIEQLSLLDDGLVIIGSVSLDEAKAAKLFADKMGWPLLCDVQCGMTSEFAGYDLWLPICHPRAFSRVKQVVQFGARIVSKRLNQWLVEQAHNDRAFECHIVSPDWRTIDPNGIGVLQHQADIPQWVNTQTELLDSHSGGAKEPRHRRIYHQELISAKACRHAVSHHIKLQSKISEVAIAQELGLLSPKWDLFIGNSLIVRLLDMLGRLDGVEVYSNRGASGIDGLLATASGVQDQRQRPLITVLGDTSFLYDLNSLARFSQVTEPAIIVVINNDGGAIFDLLPVDPLHREKLYQMPHGFHFKGACAMFGLHYESPSSINVFNNLLDNHLHSGTGTLVIEAVVEPGKAMRDLALIKSTLAQSLHETD
jgi:2-succinyl-5-enolpyruvyl-6-hydroxy-3-cyclohexene-1-carboxylate synthase